MSVETPTRLPSDNLLNLENEVNAAFDGMIDKVNKRREEVLDRLREVVEKIREASFAIEELDKSRNSIDLSETNRDVHEAMNSVVDRKIASIKSENPEHMFVCNQLEFDKSLSNLGAIVRVPKEYTNPQRLRESKPLSTCQIDFGTPLSFSYDESSKLIALLSLKNVIFIYNMEGDVVNKIQDPYFKDLKAIELANQDIYVTDIEHNEILKYKAVKGNFEGKIKQVCKSQEKLKRPNGLCFDKFTHSIYVTLSNSHSIATFNTDLLKTSECKADLLFPQFIRATESELFVLDCNNPCMHIISKKDKNTLRSLIPRGLDLNFRKGSNHFSLDPMNNLLMINFAQDKRTSDLQVYSPCGQLIHVFSSKEIESIPLLVHVNSNLKIITIAFLKKGGWVIQSF